MQQLAVAHLDDAQQAAALVAIELHLLAGLVQQRAHGAVLVREQHQLLLLLHVDGQPQTLELLLALQLVDVHRQALIEDLLDALWLRIDEQVFQAALKRAAQRVAGHVLVAAG